MAQKMKSGEFTVATSAVRNLNHTTGVISNKGKHITSLYSEETRASQPLKSQSS